jgi:putative membrane protein
MVRDGAAEVLPFSQLGGMALGVRAAILHGIAAPLAIASMIVDVTTEMMAQIAYVALGVLILSLRAAHTPLARSLTTIFAVGLLLAAAAGAAFLAMQRYGHHWAARKLAGRMFPASMAASAAVATSLDEIYRSGVRIGASITLHLAGWVMGAAGTWIAFRLIGVQVDFAAVIALESLVYATRTAAVVVPNALGVQEAAYALLSPLLGVGKEFGLAVSLIKRARDIGLGIPTLLIWQAVEGQRALSSKPTGKP